MSKSNFRVSWEYIPIEEIPIEEYQAFYSMLEGECSPPKRGCRHLTAIRQLNYYVRDGVLCCLDPITGKPRRLRPVEQKTEVESWKAWNILRYRIMNTYGRDMKGLWGEMPREWWWLKRCVPTQISWYNKIYANQVVCGITKADISSAFPYEATKRLPTLIGAEVVSERPYPTTAFPFVFGGNGRLIFLEEDGTIIDTDVLRASPFYGSLLREEGRQNKTAKENNYVPLSSSFWLKCPAGPSLAQVMEPLYTAKQQGDPAAKAIMNIFIGFCHKKTHPSFLHLAAVILARCDNRIIKMAECLINRGCTPLLIATDSIAWQGTINNVFLPSPVVLKQDKKLGAFVREFVGADICIASPKAYQIRDMFGNTITKWSGVQQEDREKLAFGEIAGHHTYGWVMADDGSIKQIEILEDR